MLAPERGNDSKGTRTMNATKKVPAEYLVCELLDALKLAVRALQDLDADDGMAGEFEILTDAIDRAESRA